MWFHIFFRTNRYFWTFYQNLLKECSASRRNKKVFLKKNICFLWIHGKYEKNIWLLDIYAIIISSLVIHSGIQLELLIWIFGIRVIPEAYSVSVSKCDWKRYGGCSQGVTSASRASDCCHFLSVPPITESGASWSLAVTESTYFWETVGVI